jgi:alpha-1,2-mannosyltransferase
VSAAAGGSARYRVAAGAAAFAVSVGGWVALVAGNPGVYWQQTDAVVYREAGLAVRHGAALYAQTFGPAHLPFTYPPFAALVFAALSPLSFAGWQLVLAAAGLCCLVLSAHAALRLAARGGPGIGGESAAGAGLAGAFVVAGLALWLEPVALTLHFGQINLILLALVLVDLARSDTARGKGIGIGIAAGLKLTPLVFVAYLLVTRRVRAAAVSLAAFAGTVAVGFAVLGQDSAAYWAGQFARPGDNPERLVNQSLNGLVLRALRDRPGAHLVWICVAVLVGVVGIGAAALAARRGQELLGVCLCAATGLLISPISWSHHWVYVLVPLAFAARRPLRTGNLLAVAAVIAVFAWWPLRLGAHGGLDPAIAPHPSGLLRLAPHDNGAELRWTWWQLVYGDGYVLAAVAFVFGCAGRLLAVTARRGRPGATSTDRDVVPAGPDGGTVPSRRSARWRRPAAGSGRRGSTSRPA